MATANFLNHKDGDIDEASYQCPGESDKISFAVHQARLEAGWPGCTDCIWNDQSTLPTDGKLATAVYRAFIQRTPFGVRGAYLNAINRTKASLLASIFTSHLTESEFDRQQQKEATTTTNATVANELGDRAAMLPPSSPISAPETPVMIVGYDSDPNSPNLFAGIVQAVRQAGSNAIDIGCCTAASLQHSIRHFKAVGGIIVTSATASEMLSGEIGFDVFDQYGQSISVPWQKFGIRVRLSRTNDRTEDSFAGSKPEQFAQDLRKKSDFESHPAADDLTETDEQLGELILPDTSNAATIPSGRRRHSGQLQTQSMEITYRNSMLKWWGQSNSKNPIRLYCPNEIVIGRVEWLASASSAIIEIHQGKAPVEKIRTGGPNQPATIEIVQDDRLFRVWSRTGRPIEITELVEWLNLRLSRKLRHVTAHAANPFPMIRLLDLAGPDSGASHDTTVDAVAITGLLLCLNDDGRHPLPV